MSKLVEQFRTIRVFNNFDLLKKFGIGNDVAVEYYAKPPGRMGMCETNKTKVWSPFFPVDKEVQVDIFKNPHRGKIFYGKRAKSFPEALEFVEKTYGFKMVNSPFGGQVPENLMKHALKFLKENKV